MGKKGDKMTQDSVISAELIVDNLSSIEGVSTKKMFGGHGIFYDRKMFGLIDSKGKCFLKADESNMEQFTKANSVQHSRMPYYSIPENVLGDRKILEQWTLTSIAISKK